MSLVEDERRLAAGDKAEAENKNENNLPAVSVSTLVTSDGTYATQSVFSTNL